jgi:hypothetical protein
MDEAKAREILGEWIQPDGSLREDGRWLHWNIGQDIMTLEGYFVIDELRAIVYWIDHHSIGEEHAGSPAAEGSRL